MTHANRFAPQAFATARNARLPNYHGQVRVGDRIAGYNPHYRSPDRLLKGRGVYRFNDASGIDGVDVEVCCQVYASP